MSGSLLRLARDITLAVFSFAAGTALVRPLVPPAEGQPLKSKIETFELHRDDYDTLYIGASRIYRGLDPTIVDAELGRAGVEMHSFNFGAGGMRTFEQDFILHYVLDLEPERLERIFLAIGPVGMTLSERHVYGPRVNMGSERGIQWHTPRQTLKVLQSVRRLPVPLRRKLELARQHLEILAMNVSNFGRGWSIAARLLRSAGDRAYDEQYVSGCRQRRGHLSMEELKSRPRSEGMDELLLDPAWYLDRVASIPAENDLPIVLDELNVEIHRAQQRAAAEQGIELIYVTPPAFEGSPEQLRLHELGILPTLFHFNDPDLYPALFRMDHRYDPVHLNRRGIKRFSRLFAGMILDHLRAGETLQ